MNNKSIVKEKGSEIPSLDGSNLSYEFEKIRVKMPEIVDSEDLLYYVDDSKKIPKNLEYLDDFYDKRTGTSGTAFRDKNTGKVIVSYTGNNLDVNTMEDIYDDF